MIRFIFYIKYLCVRFEKVPLISIFFKVIYRFYNIFYGASIGYKAKFINIPKFPHNIAGVFISENAIIGRNCTIFHNVTIGSIESKNKKLAPVIGDNVFIGAGAIIIGNVKVGNNVKIGAGAIVHKNIPENSTVVMSGLKIILKNE